MKSDSARISPRIVPPLNPRVLSTASSLVRSRTDCAIVLAATRPNMKSTTDEMAIMIAPMSPICFANPSMKPFSVVVFVSADELANISSKVLLSATACDASEIFTTYHPTSPSPSARFSFEIVVPEEELRLVNAVVAVVDADEVEFPCLALLRLPDRPGERDAVSDLPAEALGEIAAHDRALAVRQPGGRLVRRKPEFRVDLQKRLRLDGDVREEVRWLPVDAVEPRLMRGELDTGRLLQTSQVRIGQRHDQTHLVNQNQPIEPRNVDAQAERGANRHQEPEKEERDENRQQGKRGAELPSPDVLPDERKELHDCPFPVRTPLSRCNVRLARSAARGSCVTMTMVLP